MEQDPENKKELIISIVDKLETLKEDELAVLDYLKAVAKKTKNAENPNSFKMSELVKFSNKYPLKMASVIDEISKMQESREKKDKYYDKKSKSQYLNYAALATLTLILGSIMLVIPGLTLGTIDIIPALIEGGVLLIYGITCAMICKRSTGLSDEGLEEKYKWIGLKNYMEDFSMIDDREVPELVLWEKYLVYATAFGIADKVLKQIKIRYPELQDNDYMVNNMMITHAISNSTISRSFESSISRSVLASSSYSSGSGGGGGFSGGRRWRRWRRRRRRPLNLKKYKKIIYFSLK